MNLHRVASGVIAAVNPPVAVSVQINTGEITNDDFTRAPSYADPVTALAQVQPLTNRDLRQIDGLNLQGTLKAIYLSGQIDGIVRSTNQGGDKIVFPDGSTWLVTLVSEGWDTTAGWCKVIATLQNDTPGNAGS